MPQAVESRLELREDADGTNQQGDQADGAAVSRAGTDLCQDVLNLFGQGRGGVLSNQVVQLLLRSFRLEREAEHRQQHQQ